MEPQDMNEQADRDIDIEDTRTFVITVCPPCDWTKFLTLLGGALSRELPPGRKNELGDGSGDIIIGLPMKCCTLEWSYTDIRYSWCEAALGGGNGRRKRGRRFVLDLSRFLRWGPQKSVMVMDYLSPPCSSTILPQKVQSQEISYIAEWRFMLDF